MLDEIWKAVKVVMALSPMIGIILIFLTAYDDKDSEEKRRKEKFDFAMDSGE